MGSNSSFVRGFGKLATGADPLIVRNQPGDGRAVLEQHERDVLAMGAVDAIGKISGGVGDANRLLFHKIRLSDLRDGLNPEGPEQIVLPLDRPPLWATPFPFCVITQD